MTFKQRTQELRRRLKAIPGVKYARKYVEEGYFAFAYIDGNIELNGVALSKEDGEAIHLLMSYSDVPYSPDNESSKELDRLFEILTKNDKLRLGPELPECPSLGIITTMDFLEKGFHLLADTMKDNYRVVKSVANGNLTT